MGRVSARWVAERWPHARAALIALAIVVGLLDGCPIPRGAERPVMERRVPPAVVDVIDAVDRVRTTLLRPFRPLADAAKLRQRWRLFSGANRSRYRMRVEARTGDGDWELVYRVLDDDHAFRADAIEQRHVRGAWNPHAIAGARPGYPAFARWIGGEVLAAFPRYTEVRVAQEKIAIRARGGYEPTGELVHVKVVKR